MTTVDDAQSPRVAWLEEALPGWMIRDYGAGIWFAIRMLITKRGDRMVVFAAEAGACGIAIPDAMDVSAEEMWARFRSGPTMTQSLIGLGGEEASLHTLFGSLEVSAIRYAVATMRAPKTVTELPTWARLARQSTGVEIQLSVSPARWLRCEWKADARDEGPYFWQVECWDPDVGVNNGRGWARTMADGLDAAAQWYVDWLKTRGEPQA